MLNIRKEQMEVLGSYMKEQFALQLMSHLRQIFPDRTSQLSDQVLLQAAHNGIEIAQKFGIEYEDDIQRVMPYLIEYKDMLNDESETNWIGNILRREDLDGSDKADMIQYVGEELR